MTDIAIRTTKQDLASKSLQVTIPAERVKAAEAGAVAKYAKSARLPGFRKGKAPEALVRRKYAEAIRQTVLEEVVQASWEQAREAEKLRPVGQPHIHDLKWSEADIIEFELHVDVHPELTLAKTGGFKLSRTVVPVTDAQLTEQLDKLREQKATWTPVEGAKPAPGNLVELTIANLDEGEDAEARPYSLVLGEGQAIPDLEERVLELGPGETREVTVKFPEDYPEEAKRGQARKLRLTLREVKRQELPALDDEFAREIGEFDDVAALTRSVREDLEKEAVREADAKVREALIAEIVKANDVPAPKSLVERLTRGYAEAYGIPEAQLGTFRAEFAPVAEAQVRRGLVLDAVVEAQKLAATEADIDARVSELAGARNAPPAQLYASLEKSGRLRDLERSLTEEKAFTWLLSQSTVTEAKA
ncbi:MAG TPA: trigger factor [Gemmatimonadales bacterium]|nr:trigger factor [Gemmatimonadales bacterium]